MTITEVEKRTQRQQAVQRTMAAPSKAVVTRALNVLWWLYLYQGHAKPHPRPRQWRPGGKFLRGITVEMLAKQPGAGDSTVALIIAWRDYLTQRKG